MFGGVGKVDVALEDGTSRIACEIAVTNTIGYELQNIQKCLASGFDHLVVISPEERHLQSIKERAELVVSTVHLSKVHFLEPESFHLFLEALAMRKPAEGQNTKRVRGYTVKTETKESSTTEAAAKKSVILEILSKAIRRNKRTEDE